MSVKGSTTKKSKVETITMKIIGIKRKYDDLRILPWDEVFPRLNSLWNDTCELALAINELSEKNRRVAEKKLHTAGKTKVLAELKRLRNSH